MIRVIKLLLDLSTDLFLQSAVLVQHCGFISGAPWMSVDPSRDSPRMVVLTTTALHNNIAPLHHVTGNQFFFTLVGQYNKITSTLCFTVLLQIPVY